MVSEIIVNLVSQVISAFLWSPSKFHTRDELLTVADRGELPLRPSLQRQLPRLRR